jgi:hypothetical protein
MSQFGENLGGEMAGEIAPEEITLEEFEADAVEVGI